MRLKTGVKRDGTLVAQQAYCYFNTGPYADSAPNLITRGYAATGPYRVPHVYVDSYGVYTNVVPAGRVPRLRHHAGGAGRTSRRWT